ncbi:MAG TPA: hypothetical protein PLR25_24195 [Planctomycetaceae bacterium]|nr:hypothetical protein [Planctomycetaceae bacterium]
MILALDLDGTIDELPEFFRQLTTAWSDKVFIITFRLDQEHAEEYARRLGVRFDALYLASSHQDKGRILKEIGARVFIEDSDEAIHSISQDIFVLKVRHIDNYDFLRNQWT